MKAVVLTRVSTSHQTEKGSSLKQQARVCKEFCERYGLEVVETLVGIDACIKCSLTQICALDAANLLAFLLESDGGHGFRKSQCAPTYKHPA